MRRFATLAVLSLLVATRAAAADKGVKPGTGSCYFAATGACWENYVPDMCATEKYAPGAACPTANRVGTCKTGNRVMRLYTDKYTVENAAAYCKALSGRFEKG